MNQIQKSVDSITKRKFTIKITKSLFRKIGATIKKRSLKPLFNKKKTKY